MDLFSKRYGYTKPSNIIIREQITPEIESAICNCYGTYEPQAEEALFMFVSCSTFINYLNKKLQ